MTKNMQIGLLAAGVFAATIGSANAAVDVADRKSVV